MTAITHLLVLSQPGFIDRQLGTAFIDAAAGRATPRGKKWAWPSLR